MYMYIYIYIYLLCRRRRTSCYLATNAASYYYMGKT